MEEDSVYEKPASSAFFRHRSPVFSKEEVKALLKIVEKHKSIILNKSTSAAACFAKETTWIKIAKLFNRQGFSHTRSADCLKIKWDNLKKGARKFSKNLIDPKYSDVDDVTNQMIVMMCDVESSSNVVEPPAESDEEINDSEQIKESTNESMFTSIEDKDSDDTLNGDENERLVNRSLNFSPKECNLLLQCVRQEKNIILSKGTTSRVNKIKDRAWTRITNSYNKLSPQKRSSKVLRTKFSNMKRLAKKVGLKDYIKDFGRKHEKLEDNRKTSENIKCEPVFEEHRSSSLDADEEDNLHDTELEVNNHVTSSLDPLRSVLNSDFGTVSINNVENKEIVKLKTELLQFKIETAKLQRKHLENVMQAETTDREAKAIETSLRLRAARLEVVAAEMKLSQTHPALAYTPQETRAQHYMLQYHAT